MIWLVRLLFFFALLALVSPARYCSTLRLLLLQHLLLLLLLLPPPAPLCVGNKQVAAEAAK